MRTLTSPKLFRAVFVTAVTSMTCMAVAMPLAPAPVIFLSGKPSKDLNDIKSDVEPSSLEWLDNDAALLKANPSMRVKLLGYADRNECKPEDCEQLALRRARDVEKWLLGNGVSRDQITGAMAVPHLNDLPAGQPSSPSDRMVEFSLSKESRNNSSD